MKKAVLVFAGIWLALPLSAQQVADSSFFEMSLEQLMMTEISVTSNEALTTRDAPGIVTLITEDEIRTSGARDLMDLLELVPGFHFGCDVEGVTALGIRGNWAHEGKMLLLIDGIEMNELMYSTLQFGNHYPIDQIKRIEIIRGPGSAVYGGYAEYAVINIITINNKEFTGVSAAATYGQMKETFSRRNISMAGGHHFGDLALNVGMTVGEGNRSDGSYTDYLGNTTNLADKQRLDPSFVQLAASYKGLSIHAIADNYHTTTVDGYDILLQEPYPMDFTTYAVDVRYKIQASKRLSITPRFCYRYQAPWKFTGTSVDDEFAPYYRTAQQPLFQLAANYDMSEHVTIQAGAEHSADQATDHTPGSTFTNGATQLSLTNNAVFAQARCNNSIADITVGARYHNNNRYDPSFVPRIGVTKRIGKFHTKLLFSKAFRAPGIENINRSNGNDIDPENTTVTELETGYLLSPIAFVSVNAYDITTSDVIVYSYDHGTELYANNGKTGTRGLEVEFKLKGKLAYGNINYAFYTTQGKTVVSAYSVPGKNVLLAFPAHQVNLSGCLKITGRLSISGSLIWQSTTYDYDGTDSATSASRIKSYPSQLFANLYLGLSNVFAEGNSMGIGCRNITDEQIRYIQPYNSDHAPLPGSSREFYIKMAFAIP